MSPRYSVIPPVEGPIGYPYFKIIDRESKEGQNFSVAEFFHLMPFARHEAKDLCRRLNALHEAQKVD